MAVPDTEKKGLLVLIIGSGTLALKTAGLLSWAGFPGSVIIGCRDAQKGERIKNMIRFSSRNLGRNLKITVRKLDLENECQTAETMQELDPDLVLNTATLQTYWIFEELNRPVMGGIQNAGVGPWTSLHMYPVYRLMRAVKMTDVRPFIVNSAFPDAVNPALKTMNLAPDSGAGNLANLVPAMLEAAKIQLPESDDQIRCKLVAHHAVSNSIPSFGHSRGAPYSVQYSVCGDDITHLLNLSQIEHDVKNRLPRIRGRNGMWVTASSVVNLISSVLSSEEVETHAPGVYGLAGGCPIRAGRKKISLSLPNGMELSEAEDLNFRGQKYDGIEVISEEGFMEYTDKSKNIIEDITGIRLERFYFSDIENYAKELLSRYQEFHRMWRQ